MCLVFTVTPTTCSPLLLDAKVQSQLPNVFVLANKPPEHQFVAWQRMCPVLADRQCADLGCFRFRAGALNQQLVHSRFRLTLNAH